MKRLFTGLRGRWLAMEAIPAYVLIFAVWPLTSFFGNTFSAGHGFVAVFASADCAAVAFCFLISAHFDLHRYLEKQDAGPEGQSWWVPMGIVCSLIFSMVIYVAMKLNPMEIVEGVKIPNKAYLYCFLSCSIALGTSAIVYHSKR